MRRVHGMKVLRVLPWEVSRTHEANLRHAVETRFIVRSQQIPYCARGSTIIRRVKVPLSLGLGGLYPNPGVMPRGPAISFFLPEGRASAVRQSLKGLRRSTRP